MALDFLNMISKLLPIAACLFVSYHPGRQISARPAESPAIDLQGYLGALDRLSIKARDLAKRPGQARAVAEALPPAWNVKTDDESLTVPTTWLKSELLHVAEGHCPVRRCVQDLDDRLSAMRRAAFPWAGPGIARLGLAHSRLDQILSRREFRRAHSLPSPLERIWQGIHAWIGRQFSRLLGRMGLGPDAGRWLVAFLLFVLVICFIALVARALLAENLLSFSTAGPPVNAPRSWRDWLRDARSASKEGEFREAVRFAYWAGVYRLQDFGMWEVERARTHREYLQLMPKNHPQRTALIAVTAKYEKVWYGGAAASEPDFEAILNDLELLGCQTR
ncbi:MAG: DUF4129 domain-containing protein [Terriglobia bacterium]